MLIGWLCVCGAALSLVDLREHRLPNVLVAALGFGSCVIVVVDRTTSRELTFSAPATALSGVVVIGTGAVALVAPRLLGMGDVKLLLALAPMFSTRGADGLVLGLWLSSALALAAVLVRRAVRRTPVAQPIAYGPFLLLGTVVAHALTM